MIEHGRELAAQEHGRFGHDQVGLEILAAERRRIQIRKGDRDAGDGIDHVGRRNARCRLCPARSGSGRFPFRRCSAGCAELPRCWLVAPAADRGSCRPARSRRSEIRRCWRRPGGSAELLTSVSVRGIAACCPTASVGMALRNLSPRSGFAVAAAIARPPIGVDGELRQIGEAAERLVRSCRLAGGQRAEGIEADGVGAFGGEVGVQENFVAQFVFGVVGDVLIHVAVELLHVVGVVGVSPGRLRRDSRESACSPVWRLRRPECRRVRCTAARCRFR